MQSAVKARWNATMSANVQGFEFAVVCTTRSKWNRRSGHLFHAGIAMSRDRRVRVKGVGASGIGRRWKLGVRTDAVGSCLRLSAPVNNVLTLFQRVLSDGRSPWLMTISKLKSLASSARIFVGLLSPLGIACILFNCGTAQAAPAPNVVGSKYSDASATLNSAGFTPVVTATVGDRKARADCVVAFQRQRTVQPPPNTSASGGAPSNQVLVSLNCLAANASAKSPGYSAASPEGKAAAAAHK